MKLVLAYIRPRKRDAVVDRLRQMRVPGVSLSTVDGFGLEADASGTTSYGIQPSPYTQVVRVEAVCTDERATAIAEAIAESAQTGRRGDGKVFVLPVHRAIDIRAHNTDMDALQ